MQLVLEQGEQKGLAASVATVSGRLFPALERAAGAAVFRFDPLAHVVAHSDPHAFRFLVDRHAVRRAPNGDLVLSLGAYHLLSPAGPSFRFMPS